MALSALIVKFSDLRKRSRADACATAEPQEERKTMTIPPPRPRRRKPLDAGPFAPEIGSFRLHLAAERKAPKTVRTYTEAVAWFAAAYLIPRTSHARWVQVSGHDVQRWLVHLLTRYSDAYASNQFRALQQFFRWLAEEEQIPDPMARLRAPRIAEKLVPVFTSEELSALEKTCQGRSFAQRRDAAIIAVLTATGIRAGELAGIRYDAGDPRRSDVDLWRREITVRGKGGRPRVVRIGHEAARTLDRYLRIRSRHAQAWRPQLWLGVSNRGPMTANGIYQMIARRGRQAGVDAWTHRFRHHFSHTWLDRGGAEGDLMELNGWSSPQMLHLTARARAAPARAAPTTASCRTGRDTSHDRVTGRCAGDRRTGPRPEIDVRSRARQQSQPRRTAPHLTHMPIN
jgi:site-specific recombinase XerD